MQIPQRDSHPACPVWAQINRRTKQAGCLSHYPVSGKELPLQVVKPGEAVATGLTLDGGDLLVSHGLFLLLVGGGSGGLLL
jgi:hypothetical protein